MQRPDQFPMVPYANFVDTIGPAVNKDFLNRLQAGLQDLFGGLCGISATIIGEEFNESTYPSGKFGNFDEVVRTNIITLPSPPTAAGDHGLWRVRSVAAGPAAYRVQDNAAWVDTFDLLFSGRAAILGRARMATASAGGFVIGVRELPAGVNEHQVFVAGSDKFNWQFANNGVLIDTGVPAVDGRMYQFQSARLAGTTYAFIDGSLVVTVANVVSYVNLVREVSYLSPAPDPQDGFIIDFHRVWYQR